MFNFIKRLFHRQPINTPPKTPPDTPKVEQKKDNIGKEGELIQDEATRNALALVNQRLDTNDAILKGIVFITILSFIALLFGYFQFASTSLNDYSQRVRELKEQKFQFQQAQIDFLLKIATSGAK